MIESPVICTGNELIEVCAEIRGRGGVIDKLETGVNGKNGLYRISYFERVESSNSENPEDVSRLLNTRDGALTNSGQVEKRKASPERRRGEINTRVDPHLGSNPNLSANFERVVGESQPMTVRDRNAGHAGPASLAKFERVAESADASVADSDRNRKWPSQAVGGSTPPALTNFERASEIESGHIKDRIQSTRGSKTTMGASPNALTTYPNPERDEKQNVAAGDGTRAENPKSVTDAPASISAMRQDRGSATQTSTRPVSEGGRRHLNPVVGMVEKPDGPTQVSTGSDTTETPGSGWAHLSHGCSTVEDKLIALQNRLRAEGKLRRSKPPKEIEHVRQPYRDE